MYRTACLLYLSLFLYSCNALPEKRLALPYYNTPDFTPQFLPADADLAQVIPHTTGAFSFLNQDSLWINENNIKGRIHVANFMFTSCGSICPVMTSHMKMISDSLSNDTGIVLLSFSVMPWVDKPHVLKWYRAEHAIHNPNWHFLTGSKGAIYTLARRSYFAEEDIGYTKDSSEFLHTEHLILVDKSQRIRGIYNGTLLLEMHHLLEDIRDLKMEYTH